MTRDEAVKKIQHLVDLQGAYTHIPSTIVDALIALDLLKVDEPKTVEQQAIERLTGVIVSARVPLGVIDASRLTGDGAAEILDVLTKSGFKIVKQDSR